MKPTQHRTCRYNGTHTYSDLSMSTFTPR